LAGFVGNLVPVVGDVIVIFGFDVNYHDSCPLYVFGTLLSIVRQFGSGTVP
jgi:hypothetical protein